MRLLDLEYLQDQEITVQIYTRSLAQKFRIRLYQVPRLKYVEQLIMR